MKVFIGLDDLIKNLWAIQIRIIFHRPNRFSRRLKKPQRELNDFPPGREHLSSYKSNNLTAGAEATKYYLLNAFAITDSPQTRR